jgi:hypothetical protein
LKSKEYIHCPHIIEELKKKLNEGIASVSSKMLSHIIGNIRGRLEK